MAIFSIIAENDAGLSAIEAAIRTTYPDKFFQFSRQNWLVNAGARTTRQVADDLGIKKGGITGVAVLQLTGSYWGVANTAVWDWLKTNIEKSDG